MKVSREQEDAPAGVGKQVFRVGFNSKGELVVQTPHLGDRRDLLLLTASSRSELKRE